MWPAAYYNEIDFNAIEWLRILVDLGAIENGYVDPRSVAEVRPEQIEGYLHCHFFAGIGGWDHALRLANWPADRPIWTASLPCQPFSQAGKRRGTEDERHLWPVFRDLVEECRPPIIVGEQVASKAGRAWLAVVFADLEDLGYAVAGADLCAAGIGAPHIRQRLFWAAVRCDDGDGLGNSNGGKSGERRRNAGETVKEPSGKTREKFRTVVSGRSDAVGGLGHARRTGLQGYGGSGGAREGQYFGRANVDDGLADFDGRHARTERQQSGGQQRLQSQSDGRTGGLGHAQQFRSRRDPGAGVETQGGPFLRAERNSFGSSNAIDPRSDVVYIHCLDNKIRPIPEIESGLFPLVDGIPENVGRGCLDSFSPNESVEKSIAETFEVANITGEGRVMRLRGYGNAIVPAVAAAFVSSVMEVLGVDPRG